MTKVRLAIVLLLALMLVSGLACESATEETPTPTPTSTSTPTPTTTPTPISTLRLEGDIHPLGGGNGVIDSADLQLIAQYVVGTTTLTGDDFLSADVNDSDTIDSADLQLVAQYLVGTIVEFPGGKYVS
jgi:hypothetical protein